MIFSPRLSSAPRFPRMCPRHLNSTKDSVSRDLSIVCTVRIDNTNPYKYQGSMSSLLLSSSRRKDKKGGKDIRRAIGTRHNYILTPKGKSVPYFSASQNLNTMPRCRCQNIHAQLCVFVYLLTVL